MKPARKQIKRFAPLSLSGKKVLISDDNKSNLEILTHLLESAGMRVVSCLSGEETLTTLQQVSASEEPFDLGIFDIMMPSMNGYELAKKIRSSGGNSMPLLAFSSSKEKDATKILRDKGFNKIPIVAMTANAMKGDREKCIESGMDDYISKPIKREVVFEVLRKWVIEKV